MNVLKLLLQGWLSYVLARLKGEEVMVVRVQVLTRQGWEDWIRQAESYDQSHRRMMVAGREFMEAWTELVAVGNPVPNWDKVTRDRADQIWEDMGDSAREFLETHAAWQGQHNAHLAYLKWWLFGPEIGSGSGS